MATTLLQPRVLPAAPLQVGRSRAGVIGVGAACLALLVAPRLPGSIGIRATAAEVAFVALVVQALPFLLAGAGVAALLHGRGGRRLMASAARHPRLAAALAPLSGVALPLCDCGLVPLARGLAQRGARGAVVNGFVAGAPLTNPIVILSTLVAFPGQPMMAVGRVGVGLAVAALVAALAPPPVSCTTPHEAGTSPAPRIGVLQALGTELGRTAPVLVLGALAAGMVKGLLPPSTFSGLSSQPLVGAAAMMALAFLMSICSQADAFVAASLPVGALPRLAFLVLGPMLDLRLAALYRKEFGARWVLGYAAVVVPSVLVLATVWITWGPG